MVTCRSRIFVNLVSQWSRFFCVLSIEQLGSHAFVGKFWLLAIDFVSSLRRQIWNLQTCWLVSFGVYRCLPGALLSFTHGAWWIFIVRSVWKTWQGVLILFLLGSAEGKLVGSPYERDCKIEFFLYISWGAPLSSNSDPKEYENDLLSMWDPNLLEGAIENITLFEGLNIWIHPWKWAPQNASIERDNPLSQSTHFLLLASCFLFQAFLDGGLNFFFFCSPLPGEMIPNLTSIFSNGLVQPPTLTSSLCWSSWLFFCAVEGRVREEDQGFPGLRLGALSVA